ncbi:MAG TPA: Nif3-like dinuclear metal center hexameric protein [Candidatus Limiplasma sp.]|nr:Nif3-like dinuclear metal center hexameric protein [Candidatus Limiplasma sp.]HPR77700.1 Nif3-like dinuclear metal center hexameric protein [Candidatus Limiplasma sp.]
MTVQQIIDGMIKKTGVSPLPYEKTCDHLMTGKPDQEVTRIVSTFMATVDVIRKAAELGAEFIITHEPTWFTGADDTAWLAGDEVYEGKLAMIRDAGIAIWRFHDHMHMDPNDGIFRGFSEEIGWDRYSMAEEECPAFPDGKHLKGFYQIPETTLGNLADFLKQRLNMPTTRLIGDPEMPVERVALMPGGGSLGLGSESMPMDWLRKYRLDVMLCGEVTEWTLPAYVRDAYQLGLAKAIIILGHERSEAWGMKHLGAWMKSITGDIPVTYVESGEPFQYR